MKAIILGTNGKESIREALRRINNPDVYVFRKLKDGRWLRDHLKGEAIKTAFVNKPSFNKGDTILKWGNSIPVNTGDCIYYNNGLAVNNASNKLEARFLMEEAGIDVPYTCGLIEHVKAYPVIVRPIKHRAGKYFYIAQGEGELRHFVKHRPSLKNGYYMQEIFDKDREFRLHCAFGKVLVMKEKPAPPDKKTVAWNFAINEEAWTTIDRKDYDAAMCKLALESMDAIGLDIGAVDVMSKGKEHVICEINTSPSLTDYLADKYAMLFNKIFKSTGKLENFDYKKFTDGKSFAWKNFQLNEIK